jgi:hypothetical protein
MRSLLVAAKAAVIVVALSTAGCLKSDDTITIYPDGSGKIDTKMTFIGMMAQMIKMGGNMQPPGGEGGAPEKADPFTPLKKNFDGSVYWKNLKAEDGAEGQYTLSGQGYFEDVNKIKKEQGQVSFKKNEDGSTTFAMKSDDLNGPMGGGKDGKELSPEQEQMQKQMMESMKPMLAGLDMKVTVVMPGAVKNAAGFKASEGRKAIFSMDEKTLLAIMDKKQEPPKELSITAGPADEKTIADEMASFKKELAEAKVASEKEAADKKADDEKKAAEKKAAAERRKAERERKKQEAEKGAKDGKEGEKQPAGGEKKPQDF